MMVLMLMLTVAIERGKFIVSMKQTMMMVIMIKLTVMMQMVVVVIARIMGMRMVH